MAQSSEAIERVTRCRSCTEPERETPEPNMYELYRSGLADPQPGLYRSWPRELELGQSSFSSAESRTRTKGLAVKAFTAKPMMVPALLMPKALT